MTRAIGRMFMVPLGFVLATIAALAMLLSIGLERATYAVHGGAVDLTQWNQILDLARGFYGLASAATIVPALLLVITGEVARIRSSIYYILGGGAALSALPLLVRTGSLGRDLSQVGLVWQVFATAGFAGGLVYWVIAGRRA